MCFIFISDCIIKELDNDNYGEGVGLNKFVLFSMWAVQNVERYTCALFYFMYIFLFSFLLLSFLLKLIIRI